MMRSGVERPKSHVRLRLDSTISDRLNESILKNKIAALMNVNAADIVFDKEVFLSMEKMRNSNNFSENIAEQTKTSYIKALQRAHDSFKHICDVLQAQTQYVQSENNNVLYNKLRAYNDKLFEDYKHRLTLYPAERYQDLLLEQLRRLELLLKDQIVSQPAFAHLSPESLLKLADEYLVIAEKPTLITMTPFHAETVVTVDTNEDVEKDTNEDVEKVLVQVEIPQSPLDRELAEQFIAAKNGRNLNKPLWYRGMSVEEKLFFNNLITDEDTVDSVMRKIPAISSRHRTIPGVPNFLLRFTRIMDANGNLMDVEQNSALRYRSSHVASRDISTMKLSSAERLELRKEITKNNIKIIIETFLTEKIKQERSTYIYPGEVFNKSAIQKIPILLQTLISPIVPSALKPDRLLDEDKKLAIKELSNGIDLTIMVDGVAKTIKNVKFANIIDTNHPLNKWRYVSQTGGMLETDHTGEEIDKIIDLMSANEHLKESELKKALIDLKNDTSMPTSVHEDNQRELHLAALEEMAILRLGGLAYGSCVSGKDRKALQAIYVDAMHIYYFLYDQLYLFNDTIENQKRFANIFAEIYLTRHQEECAGLNAPGAEGIKTIAGYLPDYLVKAIIEKSHEQILKLSDRMASNNEFDKLLKGQDISDKFLDAHKLTSYNKQIFRADYADFNESSTLSIGKSLHSSQESVVKDLEEHAHPQPQPSPKQVKVSNTNEDIIFQPLKEIIDTLLAEEDDSTTEGYALLDPLHAINNELLSKANNFDAIMAIANNRVIPRSAIVQTLLNIISNFGESKDRNAFHKKLEKFKEEATKTYRNYALLRKIIYHTHFKSQRKTFIGYFTPTGVSQMQKYLSQIKEGTPINDVLRNLSTIAEQRLALKMPDRSHTTDRLYELVKKLNNQHDLFTYSDELEKLDALLSRTEGKDKHDRKKDLALKGWHHKF